MQIDYAARGGRVTKWKGMIVSIAPGVLAIVVALHGADAQAQEVTTTLSGPAGPTISDSAMLAPVNQSGTADLQAIVNSGVISQTTGATTNSVAADVNANAITAGVISNTASTLVDLSENAASGSGSNTVLATAMRNVANDAFAAIISTSITNSADIGSPSSVGLSDNSLSSSVGLSSSTQILQGDIAQGFGNTDAGAMAVNATSNGITAGLSLSVTQLASDVQNDTAGEATSAFASITGSAVTLTISDTVVAGNTNSLIEAGGNRISAAFTGNAATSGINVQADGMPLLASTAGISSLQDATQVGTDGTQVLTSALVDSASGISIGVDGAVTGTTVTARENALTASATENTARNTLKLDPGVSVDGQTSYGSLDISLSATGADVKASDLFVSSVQRTTDSNVSSLVQGDVGVAVSAAGSLSGATLQSIDNTLAATTLGNTGVNVINAGEANSLSAMVSATNVQSFQSAADAGAPDFIVAATAEVEDATLSLSAATGEDETLTDSTVALSSNDVTASASANRIVQDVRLAGNVVDAGQTSANTVSPTTTLDATPGTVDLASGISTGNLQITTGESGSPTATVLAQIDGDKTSATLNIGNSMVADRGALASARLALDENTFVAGAVANDATQGLTVNANALTASVAQASQQVLTGGVEADNSDTGLALGAYATTATNVTTSLDGNLISAGATGNLADNAVSVTANELTMLNAVVADGATDPRDVLSSKVEETGVLSATAAISLLNSQSTSPQSTSSILSALTGATATNSLTASGAVSGVTLSTDANAMTSMARANAAQNELVVDLGLVDMTAALSLSAGTSPTAAGTNLAALGSAQFNSSAVTSTIDAGDLGGSAITAGLTGGATTSDTAVTANDNRLTSLASGNSVTNNFQLSATNLVTTDTSAPVPTMALSAEDAGASTLTVRNAALAVGNEQANSGTITSTVGAGSGVTTISASLLGTGAVSDSLVAADGNRVLAQAVAASGATNTATIDATNLTTSALVGSVQINSGTLAARVGAAGSGVLVEASLGASGTASETSLSASENVVGATATALTDTTTLRLGGENTALIAGTDIGTGASASTGTTLGLTADYGLAQSQTNSAAAGAVTEEVTIATLVGTFTDGAIDSSGNLVLAQASGALGDARLEATAASLVSSGATGSSDPVFALAASQTNGGAISGTLTDADITMTAANLGTVTTSETLTLRENTLLASASGVSGTTLLNSSAVASAGSVVDGATAAASSTAVTADRMLIAEQTNSGAITATSNGTPSLSMTVTAAAEGASLDLGANAILATATGISGGNTLLTDAGAENAATAALSAVQNGSATADISAVIAQPELEMTVGSATNSALVLDANAVTATATGATLANRLITSGATISPVDGGTALATTDTDITGASSALYASQVLLGDVTAAIDDTDGQPLVQLSSGGVSNATLSVDGNRLSATATNGQATNTLAELSDTLIGHTAGAGGLSLLSMQSATGTTSAAVDGAGVLLAASSTVAGSTLSIDGNASLATATGLSASNRTALEAGTSLTGAVDGDIGVLSDASIITATSSLMNSQSLTGSVTATIDPTGSDVNGMLLTATGDVSGDSFLSVASNTLRAQATGVSAGNLATVSAGSVTNATTALANDQSSTAALASTLSDPRFGVTASGTVSGSVDVTGNRAIASTTAATATNTLAMTSATLISGSEAGAITLNADAGADLVSGGEPIVALLNRQVTSGNASATINNTGTTDPVLVSAYVTTGSVAVESNWLVSQSRGNVADNSLSLVAGTTVGGQSQALLASNQNRESGAISSNVTGATGPVLGADVASLSGNLSVDNNLVRASGAANTVVNTMSITAAAINVGAATETASIPSSPSVTTNANFAVLNGQENASSVTAAVTDYDLLAKATGTATGSLSLNGNMVMADATGNSSITTLRLAAAGTGAIAPMAAVTNQINDGAMSATVTGVSFTASANGTSGTASLAGNSISATSTGNLSNTVVGSPGSVFTSF